MLSFPEAFLRALQCGLAVMAAAVILVYARAYLQARGSGKSLGSQLFLCGVMCTWLGLALICGNTFAKYYLIGMPGVQIADQVWRLLGLCLVAVGGAIHGGAIWRRFPLNVIVWGSGTALLVALFFFAAF